MSITVGIFDSQSNAEDAIDRLDALGLEEGSIHVLTRRRAERNRSAFGIFARAFQGGDGEISAELTRLGLDEDEAAFFEDELDSEDAVLVAVEADDDEEDEVMAIMRRAEGTVRG